MSDLKAGDRVECVEGDGLPVFPGLEGTVAYVSSVFNETYILWDNDQVSTLSGDVKVKLVQLC